MRTQNPGTGDLGPNDAGRRNKEPEPGIQDPELQDPSSWINLFLDFLKIF